MSWKTDIPKDKEIINLKGLISTNNGRTFENREILAYYVEDEGAFYDALYNFPIKTKGTLVYKKSAFV
jgi:hypothetical protein